MIEGGKMADRVGSNQQKFEKWLSSHRTYGNARTLLSTQKEVEALAKRQKSLEGSLYELEDPSEVSRIRAMIESNHIFRFTHKSQFPYMLAFLRAYRDFLRETALSTPKEAEPTQDGKAEDDACLHSEAAVTTEKESAPQQGHCSAILAESLLTYLSQSGIFYVDNRAKGGCLWIRGGKRLQDIVDRCEKRFGVRFQYAMAGSHALNGAQGWWTKDVSREGALEVLEVKPRISNPATEEKILTRGRIPDTWIQYNFDNSDAFVNTYPAFVCIAGTQYSGKNWVKILENIVNGELKKHPAEMESLTNLPIGKKKQPFFLEHRPVTASYIPNSFQADNGYWINAHMTIPNLIRTIHELCAYLSYPRCEVIIYGAPKKEKRNDNTFELQKSVPDQQASNKKVSVVEKETVEKVVLLSDLEGISLESLAKKLNTSVLSIKDTVTESDKILDISGRLVHEDSLIDWEDAQEKIDSIITKLMEKNNGYVSAPQLYDYMRTELPMFLNDHNINNQACAYFLAQFLYEKKHYKGKEYSFSAGMHISKGTKVANLFELAKKFSVEHDGFFSPNDLANYYISLGSNNGTNIGLHMRINKEPVFFYYDEDHVISADAMGVNEAWITKLGQCIQVLMNDVGDHIVLRNIQSMWYDTLPKLPAGRPWTGVLLQSVLVFYGEQFGVHTIAAPNTRSIQYLQVMLAANDSEVQTFCDAVAAMFIDNNLPRCRYKVDEFHALLVDNGLMGANQLIGGAMAQALTGDPRFAWDIDGKHVTVNI